MRDGGGWHRDVWQQDGGWQYRVPRMEEGDRFPPAPAEPGGGICSARGMETRGSPFSSPNPAGLGHSIGITRGRVGSRDEGCSPGPYSEQDQASEASGRSAGEGGVGYAGVWPGPPHGSQAEAAGRAPDRRLETTAALRHPAPPAPPVPPPRSPAGGRHRPLPARYPPGRPPAPAAGAPAPARSGPCRDSARPPPHVTAQRPSPAPLEAPRGSLKGAAALQRGSGSREGMTSAPAEPGGGVSAPPQRAAPAPHP